MAAAVGAGAGAAAAYKTGELRTVIPASLSTLTTATDGTIAQIQFAKGSETKDALGANFIARTARDEKVRIKLTRQTDVTTKVEIRVGIFGDETASLNTLDQIKATM